MISVALFEPEIPPNTGNIARLCAATYVPLHIVGEPAFSLDDRAVRRAGLDYWPHVDLRRHGSLDELKAELGRDSRIVCLSTKAQCPYTRFEFRENDCLLFGPETRGLPGDILEAHGDTALMIPMANPHIRSLNLANSVSIVLYEALRQLE